MFTYVLLRVLHIACAATWWGLPMGMAGGIKRALERDVPSLRAAVADANRRGMIANLFGWLTLAFGVVLVFDLGGFSAIHKNIHMALGLVVVMLVFEIAFMKRTVDRFRDLVGASDFSVPSDAARGLLKRLFIGSGILQLLWVVVLVLMYLR